jgi:hypothetical protein
VIQSKELAEDLTLNLFDEIINGISIYKGSFFSVMSVKVKVEGKAIVSNEMICQLFDGINSRLLA